MMRCAKQALASILLLIMVLAGSGCGGGGVKLTKVDGKVTLDGSPLEGANITFVPEDNNGPLATGVTGSDGSYRLTTYNTGDGAVAGKYKVTIIRKVEGEQGAPKLSPSDDPKAMARAIYEGTMKKNMKGPASSKKALIHPNYSDRAKTILRAIVPPPGSVDFDLKSSGS
jgi:hypothetical protein